MIFNPKVRFTQIAFRREKNEGRYIGEAEPFYINYEKIESFGDGVLKLDTTETIYVEQDHEQINAILEAKLVEKEAYEARMRLAEKLGVDPEEIVGEVG